MKLDRNVNADGRGKYGLIKNRRIREIIEEHGIADGTATAAVRNALRTLESFGIIDWGDAGTPSEFFVIRLRDIHARAALMAYADDAGDDPEYRKDVRDLAFRSGSESPFCKKPD